MKTFPAAGKGDPADPRPLSPRTRRRSFPARQTLPPPCRSSSKKRPDALFRPSPEASSPPKRFRPWSRRPHRLPPAPYGAPQENPYSL